MFSSRFPIAYRLAEKFPKVSLELFHFRFQTDSLSILKTMRECTEDKFFNQSMLVFDEMKVKNAFEFDKKQQKLIGTHDNLQVIMIRGVASS